MQEWLTFDYRAGWGTEDFEESVEDLTEAFESVDEALEALKGGDNDARGDLKEQLGELTDMLAERKEPRVKEALAAFKKAVAEKADAKQTAAAVGGLKAALGVKFPEAWEDPGDREEANEIVQENLEALEEKRELRRQVMENGSRIDGPFFDGTPKAGSSLNFSYKITNTDDGHNLPSGSFGAQPEIWLNVALIGPDGKRVWESGYVDSNGDFADVHSLDLAEGKIEYDDQLFNLQTKFLTTNVKGTDREMYLPVNFDIDQRPFLRPINVPTTVLNHPPFVRMEGRSIPPLGSRDAEYTIPADLMKKKGKYKLAVRLRSRAEPIYFMRFVGATSEMEQSMARSAFSICLISISRSWSRRRPYRRSTETKPIPMPRAINTRSGFATNCRYRPRGSFARTPCTAGSIMSKISLGHGWNYDANFRRRLGGG